LDGNICAILNAADAGGTDVDREAKQSLSLLLEKRNSQLLFSTRGKVIERGRVLGSRKQDASWQRMISKDITGRISFAYLTTLGVRSSC
jgi:hypothetical protein